SFYCVSAAAQAVDGGTTADGGQLYVAIAGGLIWKYTPPATSAQLVASGNLTTGRGPIGISPTATQLYIADGSRLTVWYVGGAQANAPVFVTSVNAGAPIGDVAVTGDGKWVYASVP